MVMLETEAEKSLHF